MVLAKLILLSIVDTIRYDDTIYLVISYLPTWTLHTRDYLILRM